MKCKLVMMTLGVGLCVFSGRVAAPVEAAEICTWRGTAPFCDGECEQGERLAHKAKRDKNLDLFVPEGAKVQNQFGKECVTGSKALCCRAEAAPPPPPSPPAAEKLKKGPIVAPSPLEGTELKKGPIVAPEPPPPPVTVLLDVEVYDQPGGKGKVIGELKAGTQGVFLADPCRADHWCHVKGNVPNGEGWVWSGPGYQSLKV